MELHTTDSFFSWDDGWGRLPGSPSARANGRTHGVAVASDGRVVVFRQATPAVLVFSPGGALLDAWGDRFAGAHGLTLVHEDGEDRLWITDETSGEVSKLTLGGETVLRLARPDHPAYTHGTYSPTAVAVHERRWGGTGDVWVADGYGQNLVHRYDEAGQYLDSLTGEAAAFTCPHGLCVDTRRGDAELVVADRGNRRLQVFGVDGRSRRTLGAGVLDCPCEAVPYGDGLVVPELGGWLTLLDADGHLVGSVGRGEATSALPGWPDVAPEHLRPGVFNSPHAAAADPAGTVYVVEWIVGGRLIRLERAATAPPLTLSAPHGAAL